MNIVLLEPEIPFNTGAIGRTCVATGSGLHLIRPYGFRINDRYIKRAGLDYWEKAAINEYDDLEDFMARHDGFSDSDTLKLWYATTKAELTYADVSYGPDDYIMFGKESAGIPEDILKKHPESCIRIPMMGEERSLNLSNAVAVILYEALRQNDFTGLKKKIDSILGRC